MHIPTALVRANNSVGGSSIWIAVFISLVLMVCPLAYIYYRRQWNRREMQMDDHTAALLKRISEFENSQKVMQQQAEFQQKIIAAIVHGIKSPLKYLTLTGKQLYNMSEGENTLRDVLRSMYTSSHHMYTFTDNLLQYVKLYLQDHKPVLNSFNLYELVQEKVLMFTDIAISKGDVIHNKVPATLMIYTDRQLLSIVVHNLLDNAVKYTSHGTIILSAFAVEKRIHVAVQDTGIGMDEAIFSRPAGFNSMEPGLGLVITRQLLSMINGRIEIKSSPEVGTTVILIFEE
ncbi:sensor histidine kinase [Filimonas effusa]|uniref:histidine kinase n=1 Tax=Filimonas effusa TaxID=2508721 RepID=A0A4V1MAF1_9BACT|nr:HAMP domain-containing sensor histidine kinase [Filimonas effusa]RXK85656.1 HAMP domain-containing histidine kinase [Filimonas effusa]